MWSYKHGIKMGPELKGAAQRSRLAQLGGDCHTPFIGLRPVSLHLTSERTVPGGT
jgi:hypothetical protein